MTRQDDLPLTFHPPRVYVLKGVWDNPGAAARARRLCEAWPAAEVRTYTYADLPDIVVEEGLDHCPRMGTRPAVPPPVPLLSLFRFDEQAVADEAKRMAAAYKGDGYFPWHSAAGGGAFVFFCSGISEIRPNPVHVCRPQWRLHQGMGCPHQCAYCSLGSFLLINLNTESYLERLADLLRQNPWQKTYLYDDVMDVPTLEPQVDTLGPLMRFFEATGDRYLIIHTKSDRVQPLIDAGAPRNTILVWSLSGPTQSSRLEPRTGSTEQRVEAARRCQEAGFTIRYKFKPIIPVPRWREEAAYTIDLALRRSRPDNLSMTCLMWMPLADLQACIPAGLLDAEFLQAAEQARGEMQDAPGIQVGPFPQALREQVYRHYLAEIRKHDAEVPVTLSTESLEIWAAMGRELGVNPGNYVCGCGAGATPGRRLLHSNPWEDARQARTWNGRVAQPGA